MAGIGTERIGQLREEFRKDRARPRGHARGRQVVRDLHGRVPGAPGAASARRCGARLRGGLRLLRRALRRRRARTWAATRTSPSSRSRASIGQTGFHIVAGLEGGYIAEQLAAAGGGAGPQGRAAPARGREVPDRSGAAGGRDRGRGGRAGRPDRAAHAAAGGAGRRRRLPGRARTARRTWWTRRSSTSASSTRSRTAEMRLIRDANVIADAMMRAMLAVLKPGMLETQVAAWAYFVGAGAGRRGDGLGRDGRRERGEPDPDRQGAEPADRPRRLGPPRAWRPSGTA